MNTLKAGFSRVNITPKMGIYVTGYFIDRYADGVLDELEINALALQCGESRAVLMSVDNEGVNAEYISNYRKAVAKATGLSEDAVYIGCTHTHTGPAVSYCNDGELEKEYGVILGQKLCEAATLALEDLKDAKMGYGVGSAPNIAFVRRFRMKDGSVQTNPGVDNPDILEPIGDVDERVSVLRFDRDGADTIVLVNFANHPDVVGGCKISADWPGFTRKTVEKVLDGTKCVFFNGAQGDVNHVNVHPRGGYLNGMFMDFDDVARGYPHSEYLGRVVTGGVLQAYDKVKYVDVDCVKYAQHLIKVPANLPDPADMPEAKRINDLHQAGRDDELPYTGMMLTTIVAEAERMVKLENGPDAFEMSLIGISAGPVAFVGIPGEPFTGIGRGLKETEGWEMVIPTCCSNGYEGYFPMREAYDEGGYEARSSSFKAGVAELIIDEGRKLLDSFR